MKQLALVCLAWFAITSEGISATNINNAANDACECLKAPYRQLEKVIISIKAAKKTGDMSQLQASQTDLIQLINSSTACFEGLSKKHPEIDKSDVLKKQVSDLTEKKCPAPKLGH